MPHSGVQLSQLKFFVIQPLNFSASDYIYMIDWGDIRSVSDYDLKLLQSMSRRVR